MRPLARFMRRFGKAVSQSGPIRGLRVGAMHKDECGHEKYYSGGCPPKDQASQSVRIADIANSLPIEDKVHLNLLGGDLLGVSGNGDRRTQITEPCAP